MYAYRAAEIDRNTPAVLQYSETIFLTGLVPKQRKGSHNNCNSQDRNSNPLRRGSRQKILAQVYNILVSEIAVMFVDLSIRDCLIFRGLGEVFSKLRGLNKNHPGRVGLKF